MKQAKDEKILFEMYRRAFAASTPQGNFDELWANSPKDDYGLVKIPFEDYECDEDVMTKIVEDVFREYKVPEWRKRSFKFHFWLGCSPKTKPYENNLPG
jgi:hypothetical protein